MTICWGCRGERQEEKEDSQRGKSLGGAREKMGERKK